MKFRMDSLHYALLAVVVLLAVYCGASFFREASTSDPRLGQKLDSGNRKLDTINSPIDEKHPRNDTRIMKKKNNVRSTPGLEKISYDGLGTEKGNLQEDSKVLLTGGSVRDSPGGTYNII